MGFKGTPFIVIITGAAVTLLFISAIIDFSLSSQQKNEVNRNSILAAAIMSLVAIGVILLLLVVVLYTNKEKYISESMPYMVPQNSAAYRNWTGLAPEAQSQLIKSGFEFAQNNPALAMAAIKGMQK